MNCSRTDCSPLRTNSVVASSLDCRLRRAQARNCLKICFVKVVIVLILLLDISFNRKYWYYLVECFVLALFALSALLYLGKYLWLIFGEDQVIGTESQKRLLDGREDTTFGTVFARPALKSQINLEDDNEWHIPYWHSLYHCVSLPMQLIHKSSRITCQYSYVPSFDYDYGFITDIQMPPALKRQGPQGTQRDLNIENEFKKQCQVLENYRRKITNQFISFSADGYIQNSRVTEPVYTKQLLQCVTNLRYWISTTILHRLVTEVQHVDKVSQELGLINLKIGRTSLKALRLWAEDKRLVETCLPMLPTVLAFLNVSDNQYYLVQRIKELAKGVYMAEYQWQFFQEPQERLPTDAAIVFHLFCVYMDSQLMPTAQEGGRRPFYYRYVVICDKNPIEDMVSRVNNRANCAILATRNHEPNPKFYFFSGNEVQNCLYDKNNVFYVIIQFLTYMREQQGSILEGVSLGRNGINILDVIGDIPQIPRCDKSNHS